MRPGIGRNDRWDRRVMKRFADDPAVVAPAESPEPFQPCQANLSLGFALDGVTTRMVERSHFGPLRVQKPLYPEGDAVCHAVVVHPPGGVVAGDELAIAARVNDGASALLVSPGAAKWYKAYKGDEGHKGCKGHKSSGRVSYQSVHLEVGVGASLEWLPQETIFFNAAQVRLNQIVSLARDATYIGCDILCFGRSASGESFDSGRIEQSSSIRHDGRLVWFEQGSLSGGGTSMYSPLALAGRSVFATFIAVGKPVSASVVSSLREEIVSVLPEPDHAGVTQMRSVLVVRYLGNSSQTARRLMMTAWRHLRPALCGRQAVMPRVWNT